MALLSKPICAGDCAPDKPGLRARKLHFLHDASIHALTVQSPSLLRVPVPLSRLAVHWWSLNSQTIIQWITPSPPVAIHHPEGLKETVAVQSLSHVQLFATPWTAAHQASLSITNSQSLLKLMSIESVMPSNHLVLCHPLLLLLSMFPSIRVFSNESALHIRWPSINTSASASVLPNEYPGLISFRRLCRFYQYVYSSSHSASEQV